MLVNEHAIYILVALNDGANICDKMYAIYDKCYHSLSLISYIVNWEN